MESQAASVTQGQRPGPAQPRLAQPRLAPTVTTARVEFPATGGECVMAPNHHQARDGCRIPPTPGAKLASRPPSARPASHPPPGAGRGGSP